MASKGKTKDHATEYLETGNLPETPVGAESEDLDEQLDSLAEEQAEQEADIEVEAESEAEEEPKPAKDKKDAKKEDKPAKEESEEDEQAAEEDVDGNVADEDPNILPEEVEQLPRVQELLKSEEAVNILKDALTEGYAISTEDMPKAIEQLRLERADAHMFYQIIDGILPASTFLVNLENAYGKGEGRAKVVEPIYLSMADHLARNGFLEAYLGRLGFTLAPATAPDGTPAKAANPANFQEALKASNQLDPNKAIMDEINKLRQQISQGPAPVNADNQKYETAFENELKRLMAEKKVPEDFFADYKTGVVEMIKRYPGGSKAILDRIVKGNYSDVKRFFTNFNNNAIERAQKYNKSLTSTAKKVTTGKPGVKTPANKGNSAVKPNAAKKVKVITKEDRLSKALSLMK